MALINYIEPVSIGQAFIGFGSLIATLVIVFVIVRFFRPLIKWVEGIYNHDNKYWILEEKMLDQIAKEKGIDLDTELLKREIIQKPKQSFRSKVEEEVFNKMFPEDKKTSK